ncbi:MAG: carboxypeptidase-like regulatory domain-containing protein, partial [Flavobacterium sp.]
MKQISTLLLLFSSFTIFAQIKGTVTDEKNLPLPVVSIYVENTYNGTSSNEVGQYELNVKTTGKHTIIFQYLGYKTQKKTVTIDKFPFILDIKLEEENISLSEVVINRKEDPANAVIRKAIKAKKENADNTARFKADFYSRGLFKLKNVPKKFMGQEIGNMDGSLDSTGSGIVYLSETVSKIMYEKPDNFKEKIIASKISGNDNGF